MIDVVGSVVVLAEVVRPVLSAVDLIADRVLKALAGSLSAADREIGGPFLGTVVVRSGIVHGLIVAGVPAVGGVANEYVLVISVVLEQSVDHEALIRILIAELLGNDVSAADHVAVGVILAVIVIPVRHAVRDILDAVFGVVAGEVGFPDLGAVVEDGVELGFLIAPLLTVHVVIVDIDLLVFAVVSGLDVYFIAGKAVLGEVGARAVDADSVVCGDGSGACRNGSRDTEDAEDHDKCKYNRSDSGNAACFHK